MSKGTTLRNVRVPDEIWGEARREADSRHENLSEVVREALVDYTRRTSLYTLRLPDQASVVRVAGSLRAAVADHGDRAVSYRAGSDEQAIDLATDALEDAGETRPALLTIGLGIHRRDVAVQDGGEA